MAPTSSPVIRTDPNPIPTSFGRNKRQMNVMAEGLFLSDIYWTYGPSPAGAAHSCISDPPASGWGRALVFEESPTIRLVLCIWSFRSYRITKGSHEWSSMQGTNYVETDAQKAEWLRGHMGRKWAELARASERAGEPDWATATRFMEMLDVKPPSVEAIAAMPTFAGKRPMPIKTERSKGGGESTSPFKPVKTGGRRGEVLKAILDGNNSASSLVSKFEISRSNLLSQLFLLRKDHGIGYTVSGDSVAVQLPAGIEDPFI